MYQHTIFFESKEDAEQAQLNIQSLIGREVGMGETEARNELELKRLQIFRFNFKVFWSSRMKYDSEKQASLLCVCAYVDYRFNDESPAVKSFPAEAYD
jgi:hypothetical protein